MAPTPAVADAAQPVRVAEALTLSALIPVHAAVDPAHLSRALESVLAQTRPAEEVLVVEDGPVGVGLTAVLDDFTRRHPGVVRRVALPVNSGPGAAAALGMREARGDVVARLDSDDIALPQRFEAQLRHLQDSGCDVVGASMLEFEGEESHVVGLRRLPETHEEIHRYARTRSPINQPTAMLRRSAVLAAGNYVELGLVEDYELWARMLARGSRMSNLPEPLVLFRCSPNMFARRGGLRHLRSEWELQRRLWRYGLIGPGRLVGNLIVRLGFRLLPGRLLRIAYSGIFRRPADAAAGTSAG
jgi:glycosyltransferase involved in cell wall biosynthesis